LTLFLNKPQLGKLKSLFQRFVSFHDSKLDTLLMYKLKSGKLQIFALKYIANFRISKTNLKNKQN